MAEKKKKTAIEVVVDSFLKRVQQEGVMPWQTLTSLGYLSTGYLRRCIVVLTVLFFLMESI